MKLVCYCFGYSEADLKQNVIKNNGCSTILEKIKASKGEGTCRCHETNPSGK
ncbi:MAG TPA: BFD-like (2Fe-2S) protein [Nitrospiraceae bacterium]|nr:BFD-like (2Fe-2S) protein [Nitrospiraceae bacterium]